MKVGLLGGTFDPIHVGHLWAAETARESMGLEAVVFVPAKVPPHRKGPVTSPLDRYAMVCLATAGHPGFVPSDIELRREGPNYTVDTVRAWLQERPGDSVVLIVGSDAFAQMPTWKESERLLALCGVAVVPRPGDGSADAATTRQSSHHAGALRLEAPGLPVSGTVIRQRIQDGRSVRYLVTEPVADYIRKRGLYQ